MSERTANLNLELPTFDEVTWHTAVNTNFQVLDAAIAVFTGLSIAGVWQNATAYTVGVKIIDPVASTLWVCLVAHTSASTGTFSADRVAHPTYWEESGITADPTVRVVTAAGDITVVASDDIVLVNKSIGASTAVILPASADRRRALKIADLKGDATSNNITVTPDGSETISGNTSYVINVNNGSVEIFPRPDGLGWFI